jgi:hypothetical protein
VQCGKHNPKEARNIFSVYETELRAQGSERICGAGYYRGGTSWKDSSGDIMFPQNLL